MSALLNTEIDLKSLFLKLYNAATETELDPIIDSVSEFASPSNWHPLGNNPNNFSIVRNQQANPIAALIEKLTNSIDAILMKEAYLKGVDPKAPEAPQSMSDAVERFFPSARDWDLSTARKKQAENIQVMADGPPRDTSVIIYDNGEGQHPEKFEKTFLSLVSGNKVDIHFVQGKYNMGGSGGIVFCGKKRYQLIASKRYDGSGKMGFTLIRQHPLTSEERKTKKTTWFEYFKLNGEIPAFNMGELDLKLLNRKFTTGTLIKLYSYQFPSGYSGFAQDLRQSITEYLFNPALPIYTVDNAERYPRNKYLTGELYGLKRRLEEEAKEKDGYLEDHFSSNISGDDQFGEAKVMCYVFKARHKDKDVKKTKEDIQRNFFKNNMTVLFSINGQVHGHYTSEFVSRSLKMSLLKNHLLIHVDCTKMHMEFRDELFMASRDRLKKSPETEYLRKELAKQLGKAGGRLAQIEKHRKDSISIDSSSTQDLLKNFTKSLPKNSDLYKLLGDTFKMDIGAQKDKKKPKPQREQKEEKPFNPQPFPSFMNLQKKNDGEKPVSVLPLGGERTLKFETDVEDSYFDRSEEPGELEVAVLNVKKNESEGGDAPGQPKEVDEILHVHKESPRKGIIRISLAPKDELKVGDQVQVKVTLNGAGQAFDEIFWVKIGDKEAPKDTTKKEDESNLPEMGLPNLITVYKENPEGKEDIKTWDDLESNGIEMSYDSVMHPFAEGDNLETIYVNMDSQVLKNTKSKKNISGEQIELWDKKYISSVYFHTLFLYTITKKNKYRIVQEKEGDDEEPIDLSAYLKSLFDNFYSEFILNFETSELVSLIEE